MSSRRLAHSRAMSRRSFLAVTGGAVSALAACSSGSHAPAAIVGPDSDPVRAAENRRRAASAPVRDVVLSAEPTTVDLGGLQVQTWTYGGKLPGQEIRIARGEVLRADFTNALPQPSSIHWHGVALRDDMDGVPELTQSAVASGGGFRYEFTVPDAGTYWFHPHVGVQLDRGLYAPLIVEDPADGNNYDVEAVVVLDDWLDGVDGRDPDTELAQLRATGMAGMNMGPMTGGATGGHGGHGSGPDPTAPLGTDAGDVTYPYFLINGRLNTDPMTFAARPGQRMRLRIINAAADTAFRVAVGRHQLNVTHSDGFPVHPVTTDCLLISMGERYDAIVELGDGVFPLIAAAEGKQGRGLALIRTGGGNPPPADVRARELDETPLTAARLRADESVLLTPKAPDAVLDVSLGADDKRYQWTINGKTFDEHAMLDVREGQRVRLRFVNTTMMFHPMHLHGHTFQLVDGNSTGARKDTTIVLPNQTVEVDFDAVNPGQWMLHCHNAYHGEAGMMSVLSYVR
ncbi:multicopper oxidase family protein [Nocardia amamiensis]|uniref:Multicopper oxidase family protein n=1 Tax=Nocardia amamiensis TaxID=404578 RepID=A0ABS0CZF2_9NOCA|nr:multicopper oxidase family protein [Nocardia amamiensis]